MIFISTLYRKLLMSNLFANANCLQLQYSDIGGLPMDTVIDARVLRMQREAKGWDQRTLARKAGINPSVVSRLERGLQTDLKASVLVALAQALEIPVDTLIPSQSLLLIPDYLTNLAAVLAEIDRLPEVYQRQIAALLYGYLSALPPRDTPRERHEDATN